ncbi:hypothetical protein IMSAGC016_00048 [Muribaculaceae bacterium]|nr:hypothetical protein IMSAGC016_00048 [Muribaculaceae bacterium]
MNARQFFDKVVEMRRLQKEYFKSRSHLTLEKSKAVEREIDQEIKGCKTLKQLTDHPNQIFLINKCITINQCNNETIIF